MGSIYDEKWMPSGIPREVNERESVFENLEVRNKSVVEIGAGTLRFSLKAAEMGAALVVAVDISREMLEWGKTKARRQRLQDIDVVVADARYIPLRDKIFDAAISVELFEHIPEGETLFIKEVHRVLKGSGKAVVNCWNMIPKLFGAALGFTENKTRYWRRGIFYRYYYPWVFKSLLKQVFTKTTIVGVHSTYLIPSLERVTFTQFSKASKLIRSLAFLEISADKLFRRLRPINQATGLFLLALLEA